jgi:hypothetical protein
MTTMDLRSLWLIAAMSVGILREHWSHASARCRMFCCSPVRSEALLRSSRAYS